MPLHKDQSLPHPDLHRPTRHWLLNYADELDTKANQLEQIGKTPLSKIKNLRNQAQRARRFLEKYQEMEQTLSKL